MANKTTKYSNEEFQELINESTSFTDLVIKLGYHTKSGAIFKVVQKEIADRGLTVEFMKRTVMIRTPENIFIKNSTADQKTLRKYYLKGNYSDYKCSICGQDPIWNGKDLTLILDHINGNNKDDRFENLRWVCPNCNIQLDTYGSKNAKK